jgi:glyoxylase-like metal-dependent hydrolase (beta-lactamase superfamily II)
MKVKTGFAIIISGLLIVLGCTKMSDFEIQRQITGLETNCYLIYNPQSREAALIDVGGQIDSLLDTITDKRLKLKYFLFTHSHEDHTIGLPIIRDKYPEALVCMHRQEYNDMFLRKEWAYEFFGEEALKEWSKDLEFKKVLDFDPSTFGEPDIYVTDGQIFKLGEVEIRTILSPGHSPGGICYLVDNTLFSGDVLFHKSVGRIDGLHGSREDQIQSVRRLYTLLPDNTVVYPGHGQSTTIGFEKQHNEKISADKTSL